MTSTTLSMIVGIQFLFVYSYMRYLTQQLPSSNIPDLWFRYSPQDLKDIYEIWGPNGRQQYISAATFDMIACIPSLAFTMGYFSYHLTKNFSLTLGCATLLACCDYVSTFILLISCTSYPHGDDLQHMEILLPISSYANMAKWILAVGLFAYTASCVMQRKNKKE